MADQLPPDLLLRAFRAFAAVLLDAEPAQQPTPAAAPPGLSAIQRRILERATRTPISAKRLITAAGYKVNSYSRGAVTELVRRGLLRHDADGVRLG